TKDILDRNSYLEEKVEYLDKYLKVEGYSLESILAVDVDVFSQTDIEALEFAFLHFGDMDKWELVQVTHEYPEWEKFKENLIGPKSNSRVEAMDYADFFKNPENENDAFSQEELILKESKGIYEE